MVASRKQPPRVGAIGGGAWRSAAKRKRFVVVASQFNEAITRRLLDGAVSALAEHGIGRRQIRVCWVPGAFELPLAAAVAAQLRPDAIIALGCLIKGETPQYAAIGQAVAQALAQVSVSRRIPVGFGVIIADSVRRARARAGAGAGNRGREAALAALVMCDVARQLTTPSGTRDA